MISASRSDSLDNLPLNHNMSINYFANTLFLHSVASTSTTKGKTILTV